MKTQSFLIGGAGVLLSAGLMAAPAKPVISWMPAEVADGADTSVAWDMWWGENGTSWNLTGNGADLCEGSLTPNGTNAQSGSCTVDLTAGSHELIVNLCNDSGCTASDPKSLTVAGGDSGGDDGGDTGGGDDGGDGDTGGGDDSATAPAAPTVGWLGDQTMSNGEANFTVGWNMWWGENGTEWRLLENGVEIYSASLTANTPNAQSGSVGVTVTEAGDYSYAVSLCNGDVCTDSATSTITVAAGSGGGDDGGGDDGGDTGDFDPWTDLDMTGWPHPLKQNNQPYDTQAAGKQVGAYFVEWGIYGRDYQPSDIPAENLTHLYYGFIPICGPNSSLQDANPSGYSALVSQCEGKQDYEVVVHDKFAALEKSYPGDQWDQPIRGIFAQMYRLKQAHPDLVILPSVGGWTLSDPLYDIGTDPAARQVFIDSMIAFIKKYDFFDGIDIDWEFPGGGGANPDLGSPEDGQGFVTLMQELRVALDELEAETGRTYQLTAAMSGGVEKLSAVGDGWDDAAQVMDHINLMTYDYYGAWNNVLGHQTGLYPAPDAAKPGFSAHEAVQYMLSENVPPQKLSLGVAMYGRGWKGVTGGQPDYPFTGTGGGAIEGSWEAGIQDYKDIESEVMGGPAGDGINGYQVYWDDTAQASYAWDYTNGNLLTFDTQRSVEAKGDYVLQNNLGGLFAWEIDADNGHILNSMNSGLGNPQQ
ncbi:glycosyl hydrolase family 18 protein [Saccharospirillum salsuginis]|uniref:chitinase n=1 Tax=Saccharospirillum salsuginis TaxID=418750 RepID=A0A918KVE8_9GAMM|nr:glycosyl hydrolase family 18 protein [Saccharospirillum salsuginis]GGX74991.1 hypothetical protein GCM10007392_47720 [Saccharospirillum salsuginis]